jgi:hypothetical protein
MQQICKRKRLHFLVRHAILFIVDRLGAPLTQAVNFLTMLLNSAVERMLKAAVSLILPLAWKINLSGTGQGDRFFQYFAPGAVQRQPAGICPHQERCPISPLSAALKRGWSWRTGGPQ